MHANLSSIIKCRYIIYSAYRVCGITLIRNDHSQKIGKPKMYKSLEARKTNRGLIQDSLAK